MRAGSRIIGSRPIAMMPQACHIPLGVCGFLLCAIGCGLVPLVMFVRDGMIRELLITDTYDEWSDKHTGIDHPYTVHIWNVTNLLAVVEGGAKPAFEEYTFELTYYEESWRLLASNWFWASVWETVLFVRCWIFI